MDWISEHINYQNHKIHSYDLMRKMIVILGSKKGDNNDNSSPQLYCLHNLLLMRTFKILKIIYQLLKGNLIQGKFVHPQ